MQPMSYTAATKVTPTSPLGLRPRSEVGGRADRGRWSSRRKLEVVLRVLKGEELDALSRALGVSSARIAQWRDEFLESGQSGLVSRQADHRDSEIRRLTTKVGEQTMATELLEENIEVLEDRLRPPRRRSRS